MNRLTTNHKNWITTTLLNLAKLWLSVLKKILIKFSWLSWYNSNLTPRLLINASSPLQFWWKWPKGHRLVKRILIMLSSRWKYTRWQFKIKPESTNETSFPTREIRLITLSTNETKTKLIVFRYPILEWFWKVLKHAQLDQYGAHILLSETIGHSLHWHHKYDWKE